MRVGTQLAIGAALLLAVVGGAVTYHQQRIDGEAAAAVRRGAERHPGRGRPGRARHDPRADRGGRLDASRARRSTSCALSSGRVAEIAFRPGERVEAGAVLIRLDDQAEQAAVAEARAMLREAELALDRARKLRTNNTVAQATVDELEAAYLGADARLDAAQKQLTDRTVRAPFAGVVGIRGIDIGARVDDETLLTTLDDLAEIEIEFSVPEIFFGRVREDQLVQATSTAFPGETFAGTIATIDSRIGQVSRAFRVRAVLPNPELELPAGMFMHVSVVLEERPAVLIPEQAVLAEGGSTYAFIVADGRAERRKVRLGQREAGTVEVLDGLAAYELVVRAGLQRLRDGAVVQVLNELTVQATQEGQSG